MYRFEKNQSYKIWKQNFNTLKTKNIKGGVEVWTSKAHIGALLYILKEPSFIIFADWVQ